MPPESRDDPEETNDQDLRSLLDVFAEEARPEIVRDHRPESCIASTWITNRVFSRLGFGVQELQVRVTVCNPAFTRLRKELGRSPTEEEFDRWTEEEDAWTIGIGYPPYERGGLGGHLVSLVDGRYLVDASIDQVNAVGHGMDLPGVIYANAEGGFLYGTSSQVLEVQNHLIEYERDRVAGDYKDSYDWSSNPETSAAVDRILEHLAGRAGTDVGD